jgi:2,5-diamino-6-(ribosylamino)-4(3H)-pyrimidinone 5'-phosphate reductase
VIAVSQMADAAKVAELKKTSAVVIAGEHEVDLALLLDELGAIGVRRLMVEGGGTLIAGLFAAGLVDEFYSFVGNIIIGGRDAPTPADGTGFMKEEEFFRLALLDAVRMGDGVLLHWSAEARVRRTSSR